MTTLPDHFTLEVTEQDWEFGLRDGLNHAPVRCVVWQALVRRYPNIPSYLTWGVSSTYIYRDNQIAGSCDVWDLDESGKTLINNFDFRIPTTLPVVIEAARYLS